MPVGYARVSAQEQDRALQLDALWAAGCENSYEKASGTRCERPELQTALSNRR